MFLVAAAATVLTALARPKGVEGGPPPTGATGPRAEDAPGEDAKKNR
ncbi:MAG: hypothetical protein M3R38_04665 [Actinomycetota bacterium]|nr:hypothetical protein [Actinomycetota bacterium]